MELAAAPTTSAAVGRGLRIELPAAPHTTTELAPAAPTTALAPSQASRLAKDIATQAWLTAKIAALEKKRGPRGPRGFKGKAAKCAPGPPGKTGADGQPGNPGMPGRPGAPGGNGKNGKDGPAGKPGNSGPRGGDGPPGPPGIPGKPGVPGKWGHHGRPGQPGKVGKRGAVGKPGYPGPRGVRGKKGRRGKRGHAGKLGRRGRKGRRGPMGNPGKPGHRGKTGPRGRLGPKGHQGVLGRRGSRGKRGPRGPPGAMKTHYHAIGHLAGRVIDASTGRTVLGAKIALINARTGLELSKPKVFKNGRFFTAVKAGKYLVRAAAPGYTPSRRSFKQRGVGVYFMDLVLSRTLKPGYVRLLLTWSLAPLRARSYLRTPSGCVVSQDTPKCRKNGGDVFFGHNYTGHNYI